ncbi:MAG: acetate/propionate family kinase [Chlamydiales bacterium]|nr:acetate/propionate family kinase [Chlamydiia bacterium]MCP5507565.1 acetate/propionate family kinase [Chlamydiales bacterium]
MAILTINRGSSSVKVSLYDEGERRFFDDAGENTLEQIVRRVPRQKIEAIGHRIVHGGPKYLEPVLITERVLEDLNNLIPFDPLHLPPQLEGVEIVQKLFPDVPQVACFDTSFHRTIPEVAKTLAIPHSYYEEGIYRYGFHGLSYEYILYKLGNPKGRLIIAHLGSGASMAAVKEGKCIDTTMAFTSASGLVMSTRSGDLDPGLLLYLESERGISVEDLRMMINRESGMKGISMMTGDMKALLKSDHALAKLAVEIFCYQARKYIGALAAALGGVDTLIFTGGIGENSRLIRDKICQGIEFLGIKNIQTIRTDEEFMIALHTNQLISKETSHGQYLNGRAAR